MEKKIRVNRDILLINKVKVSVKISPGLRILCQLIFLVGMKRGISLTSTFSGYRRATIKG